MFLNLLQFFGKKPAPSYEDAFVQEVHVVRKPTRDRRSERLIWIGWALIAVKSLLVWWACSKYPVPFSALWIILPTVTFAALCTAVYYGRR